MADTICDKENIIMVVDDEEIVKKMIEWMLQKRGFAHVSFNDPLKALGYFKKNAERVTILITDLTMPPVSGAGLIKGVLQINPKLPIILVTRYDGEHVPDDIRHLIQYVLSKPFTRTELLNAVRTVLDKVDHRHPST
jgi:two-component system cell cycle sensor histidine kinase/response regulator CckA